MLPIFENLAILIFQESADNINSDSVGAGKDQLLEEACSKYKAATDICPTLHEVPVHT